MWIGTIPEVADANRSTQKRETRKHPASVLAAALVRDVSSLMEPIEHFHSAIQSQEKVYSMPGIGGDAVIVLQRARHTIHPSFGGWGST